MIFILIRENLQIINEYCNRINFQAVCASWGNLIEIRPYLKTCLFDIYHSIGNAIKWLKLGNLTKSHHPRHPSRLGYDIKAINFEIDQYLKNLDRIF